MGPMLANLAWYDLPEIRWATDALWREMSRQLALVGVGGSGIWGVPGELNRVLDYETQWKSDGFLFGQACGYDTEIAHADRLRVVATPRYLAAGCEGNGYCSRLVVHRDLAIDTVDELYGRRCAINTWTSHSGMNVWREIVVPRLVKGRFFSEVFASGSHENSLRMIAERKADVAAVDCVTYELFARHRPSALASVREIGTTALAAAPPYVTRREVSDTMLAVLRTALTRTVAEPGLAGALETLLLDGVDVLPHDVYQPMAELASLAERSGCSELLGAGLLGRGARSGGETPPGAAFVDAELAPDG